jgi:hypothetical protein
MDFCRHVLVSKEEREMPALTFAVPILPGKTEFWKHAIAEMTGSRQHEHDESRRRLGVTREIVSLQTTPAGDYVVVCLEGDDPAGIVSQYLHADTPFDRWFAETILKGTHGIDASHPPPPPNQVFVDWRA